MGEYFRRNVVKKLQKNLIILFVIIQELFYLIPSTIIWYISKTSYAADFQFKGTAVHNTMDYLIQIYHFCMMMEFSAIKMTNIFYGHRIIEIIQTIGDGTNIDSSSNSNRRLLYYRFIYVFIIIIILMYSSAFGIVASIIERQPFAIVIGFMLGGTIFGANISSLATMYLYAAILVNERIQSYKEQLPLYSNYGKLFQEMIRLRDNIGHINSHLSIAMLVKILTCGLRMATCICILDHLSIKPSLAMLPPAIAFIIMFLDIWLSCMASQSMHTEMEDFIHEIQKHIALAVSSNNNYHHHHHHHQQQQRNQSNKMMIMTNNNNNKSIRPLIINDSEYHCLEQICSMHDSFYFNVKEMFDLTNQTMLSLISYVLSNAILLIQTKDSHVEFE
ncbi:hypothetical protein DERF_011646 [Dermatophagoides farinae]|nr:hypothetical protein DERF_011646 [Dermatophagoides farinae]